MRVIKCSFDFVMLGQVTALDNLLYNMLPFGYIFYERKFSTIPGNRG